MCCRPEPTCPFKRNTREPTVLFCKDATIPHRPIRSARAVTAEGTLWRWVCIFSISLVLSAGAGPRAGPVIPVARAKSYYNPLPPCLPSSTLPSLVPSPPAQSFRQSVFAAVNGNRGETRAQTPTRSRGECAAEPAGVRGGKWIKAAPSGSGRDWSLLETKQNPTPKAGFNGACARLCVCVYRVQCGSGRTGDTCQG